MSCPGARARHRARADRLRAPALPHRARRAALGRGPRADTRVRADGARGRELHFRPRDTALEDPPELAGLHVTLEPEQRGAAPAPMARLAVLVVLARVVVPDIVRGRASPSSVPVEAEVVHRGRCGGEIDDGRDHDATLLHRARTARSGTAACGSGPSPSETPRRPLPARMEALPHVERLDRSRRGRARAQET